MYACNYGYIIFVFILKEYNDYVAKKMKRPRLSAEGLKIHIDALGDLLSLLYFSLSTLKPLRKATEGLLDAFYQYKKYLDDHCVTVKAT